MIIKESIKIYLLSFLRLSKPSSIRFMLGSSADSRSPVNFLCINPRIDMNLDTSLSISLSTSVILFESLSYSSLLIFLLEKKAMEESYSVCKQQPECIFNFLIHFKICPNLFRNSNAF